MTQMQPGEEYLSIKMAGHEYVAAFPNKNKTAPNQPDFKGDGIAVWKRNKKPQQAQEGQKYSEHGTPQ